jgi:putative toxin-antitoxin system antitoxin component (TIGR02293 family)
MSEEVMSVPAPVQTGHDQTATRIFDRTAKLLGGSRVLGQKVTSTLEAHEVLLGGLPGVALHKLIDNLTVLDHDLSLENGIGLSRRTFQRSKEAPDKLLTVDQSGRAWKFAEILSRAIEVLGSQELAEHWLEQPALALSGERPIDLLRTPAGIEMVETLLIRLEYGVYT